METLGLFFSGCMNQWHMPGRASSLVVIHQLQRELRVGAGVGSWDETGGGMEVSLILTLTIFTVNIWCPVVSGIAHPNPGLPAQNHLVAQLQ